MTAYLDRLSQLRAVAEAARVAASADAAAWFGDGIERFMAGEADLEACLGLKPAPGNRSPVTLEHYQQRNAYLREAWRLLDGTPWRRSVTLAERVVRFEVRRWPRWKKLEQPPATASAIDVQLFRAFRCGCGVPATAARLHSVVNNES